MSQTTQHEAKVKQLELELAKAKADLEAVGSLASTSQIHQAETHLPIQPPLMPEMPEFHSAKEEEQPRPTPGALDIREQMEQEIEDMPKGPAKEYLLYEKKVMESMALAFLQPEEQIKDFGSDFLPLPLMRHEAILWKEKMRPAVPRNKDGGDEGIPLTIEEAKTLIEDHPRSKAKASADLEVANLISMELILSNTKKIACIDTTSKDGPSEEAVIYSKADEVNEIVDPTQIELKDAEELMIATNNMFVNAITKEDAIINDFLATSEGDDHDNEEAEDDIDEYKDCLGDAFCEPIIGRYFTSMNVYGLHADTTDPTTVTNGETSKVDFPKDAMDEGLQMEVVCHDRVETPTGLERENNYSKVAVAEAKKEGAAHEPTEVCKGLCQHLAPSYLLQLLAEGVKKWTKPVAVKPTAAQKVEKPLSSYF
ncbi:hypothetical protein L7F22_022320 [Adiantum nelumboides]|nr:hypothetical protein [Adiantum nelumboides]